MNFWSTKFIFSHLCSTKLFLFPKKFIIVRFSWTFLKLRYLKLQYWISLTQFKVSSYYNSPILSSPSFYKRHSNGAHPRQLVNGFKTLWHRLRQQRSELLIVENFQVASGWNFANCRRMPTVARITVRTLNEDARVTETLSKDLATDVVQPDAFSDVSSRLLYNLVAVHVRQQSETKALGIWGIGEAVDGDWRLRSMESFTDAKIQLIVADRTPEGWILVHHRCRLERLWGRQMRKTWNDLKTFDSHSKQSPARALDKIVWSPTINSLKLSFWSIGSPSSDM